MLLLVDAYQWSRALLMVSACCVLHTTSQMLNVRCI
jgi:hypothetical protein